jgi:hypothetical protein
MVNTSSLLGILLQIIKLYWMIKHENIKNKKQNKDITKGEKSPTRSQLLNSYKHWKAKLLLL